MANQIIEHLRAYRYAKKGVLFLAAFLVSGVMLSSVYLLPGGMPTAETAAISSSAVTRQGAPAQEHTNVKTNDTSSAVTQIAKASLAPVLSEQPTQARAKIAKVAKPNIQKMSVKVATPSLAEIEQPEPAQPEPAQAEPIAIETQAAEPEGFVYSEKIPMSYELQEYTYQKCVERGLEYELVLAVMWRESRFKADAVNVNANGTQDSGIMQINDVNKGWLSERWGIKDLMDPYQNINAGTAMLGGLTDKYGTHMAMLAYQYGEAGMARKVANGVTTSTAIEKAYKQREVYKELLTAA